MTKICLTCKVSKSMNKAELEKIIPDWYKEIGNYSLLPPMLNNNDKYNAKKTTLQVKKPDITDYEVNIDIKEKKNTWICYWAANYTDDYDKIKTAKQAYDKFQNHGLVKTDSSGKAVMTLNCPQPYSVDGITYPRHVHYCLLKNDDLWSDDIKTIIVTCDVDFRNMEQFVKDKCHLIINVLSKESYERCKIPGSINIPLLSFQSDDAIDKIKSSLNNFDKLKKFRGKRIFELPIVIYCKDKDCKASEKMIELLIEIGFRNLLEYSEGIIGWIKKSKSKCDDKTGGGSKKSKKIKESEEPEESENTDKSKHKDKSNSSGKPRNMFDLSSNFETLVYDNKKYKHDIKTGDVLMKGTIIGKYDSDKISFNKNYSSDEESEYESLSEDEEELREELDTVKSEVDNIKYRKHKLSLVCMNDITPKIYEEKFRGWIFTFWGS